MSSDESTSTQLSVVSSQAGVTQDTLKSHISEQWEIKFIGNFLLSLYHRSLINPQNNWMCKKTDIRQEFGKFVTPELRKRFKDLNGTDNIGTLLHRCGFLRNTPRGNPYYKLKSKELFDFRNRELKQRDKCRVNDDGGVSTSVLENETEQVEFTGIKVSYEIDEDSEEYKLEYQGTTLQQRREKYYPTNMACCVCQLDFSTMDSYEEHIQMHNDEKDFEYLKELSKFDSPIFKLSYRLCKNSHYFCFTIATHTDNITIEKIIIVQSRSMFYVNEMRVPYQMPRDGSDEFYVDSHLFTLFLEQPIILISHLNDAKETRIIEEHHFVRTLEFPKVNFAIKPYRLPSKKLFKHLFKLPDYFPPIEIRDALRDDFIYEKLMKTSNEFRDYIRNEKILQPQTIGPTLTTLLHVEDMDTIKEYLNLLQHNVTLRNFGNSYSFKLKPKQRVFVESILSTFDDIIITTRTNITADSENLIKLILTNQEDMKESNMHVGRIEDVNSGRISFKCFRKLDTQRKYTLIFRPSRLMLRHQYRAMELLPVVMPFLKKFLFPGQLIPKTPSTLNLELFNKTIYDNPDQLQAVRNIAEGPRNDATYVIFGAPGTGKTTTLVESILQVLKRNGTKILVTASANSACDEIALRLCKALNSDLDMPRAIVRIYAQSNESRIDTIDDLLLEHSNMYNNVQFYPDVEILHEYRIVVCTMSVVAKLATGKFGRRENSGALYTHLFIDEVAASTEVEALMPITSVLTPKSCLIIAGDNKQLGPILKSKRAEELRLGVSLMDRLLARECYRVNTDTGDYDRSIQSRLRLNFRSHPAIVDLYSAMYYNHDLEAKAKIEDVSLIKDWHLAPSKEYPIIFHCINGNSKSDFHSFSLYNSEEVNVVMDYVKDLMYFGINGKEVCESDIGIISPYKKQYLRIREELNLRKWYSIETGSVENFQGREKAIIIVSFVRSGTSSLGFLESPRRLNVTLSRAKSLLILVGNANTLCINPDFQHIVNECKRHKTLVGKINNEASSVGQASSNDNEKALDIVNKSLSDLKLRNYSQQFSKTNSNRENATRRRNTNRTTNKENKDKNDDDNDNDDNDDVDDNKPSTSTAARVLNSSRSMTKNNSATRTRDAGKVTKAYKGEKQSGTHSNTKDNQTSKINLETYFNGLPNVPTGQKVEAAKATNLHQVPTAIFQQNMTQPTHPAQASNFQQQHPYYAMQTHTQPMSLFGPPPFAAAANYASMQQHQHYQQQQQQIQQQLQQQHRLQQRHQLQQPQQLQQQQRQQELQHQLHAMHSQNHAFLATYTNPTTSVGQSQPFAATNLLDNASNSLTKDAKSQQWRQHGKNKANQGKNANNRDGVNVAINKDEPRPLTSKGAANLNLSQTVETKKRHQLNTGKISKPYKSGGPQTTKNVNVTKDKISTISKENKIILKSIKSIQEAPMTTTHLDVPNSTDPEQNQFYSCDKETIYRPGSNKVGSITSRTQPTSKTVNPTVATSVWESSSKTPAIAAGTKSPISKTDSVVTVNKTTNIPKIAPTTLLDTRPSLTITNQASCSGLSLASTAATSNSSMVKNSTSNNNSPLSLGSSKSSSTVNIYPTIGGTVSVNSQSLSTNRTAATTSLTNNTSTLTNRTSSNNSTLLMESSTVPAKSTSTVRLYQKNSQATAEAPTNNRPFTTRTLSNNSSLNPPKPITTPYLSGTLNRSSESLNQYPTATKSLLINHSSSKVTNSTPFSSSSSSMASSTAPTTSYSSGTLHRPTAKVEIYPNTSQTARTHHILVNDGSSTSSTNSYNRNDTYSNTSLGRGTEAIHYDHFSRPVRNLNCEQYSRQSGNNSKSESKCTIA